MNNDLDTNEDNATCYSCLRCLEQNRRSDTRGEILLDSTTGSSSILYEKLPDICIRKQPWRSWDNGTVVQQPSYHFDDYLWTNEMS